MKENFTSDDYSIIDISGLTYDAKFHSYPGTFIQYLSESSDSITVALGSGGSGPAKNIKMYPGDKIQLEDKSKPFSGFYLTCEAPAIGRVLVANSGVLITPSPRISSINQIEKPVRIEGGVGAGIGASIDPISLFNPDSVDNTDVFKQGRFSRGCVELPPDVDVPDVGHYSAPALLSFFGLLQNDDTLVGSENPLRLQLTLGDDDDPPSIADLRTNALWPVEQGDIIFIDYITVVAGLWFYCTAGASTISDAGSVGGYRAPANGLNISIRNGGGENQCLGLSRTHSVTSDPDAGHDEYENLPRLISDAEDQFSKARAAAQASMVSQIQSRFFLCKGSSFFVDINLPYPQTGNNSHKFRIDYPETGDESGWAKPPIAVSWSIVLLKKGVDF